MRKMYITPSIKVAEAKFHEALLLVISVDNTTSGIDARREALTKEASGYDADEEW